MWLSPDVAPIFFAHVVIDFGWGAAAVERVTAAALGTGELGMTLLPSWQITSGVKVMDELIREE